MMRKIDPSEMPVSTLEGMPLELIERLLDARAVKARMRNGALWQVRRNGATKLWKRDPLRFRVPCKAGWKACGAIEPSTLGDFVMVQWGREVLAQWEAEQSAKAFAEA